MNHKTDHNKKRFLDKLKEALGIVSAACQATGISRQTYYNWCKTDAEFREASDDTIEERIDVAEAALVKSIKQGVPASIIFFLKTKAKKRGYIERMEYSGPDGNPMRAAISIDMLKEELPVDALEEIARCVASGQSNQFRGKVAKKVKKRTLNEE